MVASVYLLPRRDGRASSRRDATYRDVRRASALLKASRVRGDRARRAVKRSVDGVRRLQPAPAPDIREGTRLRIPGEDAFFLYTETPRLAQQAGTIVLLDPPVPDVEEFAATVMARAAGQPLLRHRLARGRHRWSRPCWVVTGPPEASRHLTVRDLADPADFPTATDDFFSAPLDPTEAAWQMQLVRGLAEGRWAIFVKIHHAHGDGFALVAALSQLLDQRTAPPRASVRRRWWRRRRLHLRHGLRVVTGLAALAWAGLAPQSSLNGTFRTSRRRYVSVVVPAREAVITARRFRASVSDLVLTVVADAAGQVLAARGDPARVLRAAVPRTARVGGARNAPGNRTAAVRVDLPVHLMSPEQRIDLVRRRVSARLRYGEPEAARFVMRVLNVLPVVGQRRLAPLLYDARWFNLIVSVFPGLRRSSTLLGRRAVHVLPVLPLADRVGIAVGAMTWGDNLGIGITVDPDLVPEVEAFATRIRASFATFVEASQRVEAAGDKSRRRLIAIGSRRTRRRR